MADLFSDQSDTVIDHGQGIFQIKHLANSQTLLQEIDHIQNQSPFRHMTTPMGHAMKVATTNCGLYGWISTPQGYGYSATDPLTGKSWPSLPNSIITLAHEALECCHLPRFTPDACLINKYAIGTSMGRHQDKDEANFAFPIISVSIGLPAIFQVVGVKRQGKAKYYTVEDGDIMILSGESRLFYHGVNQVKADPLNPTLKHRYNLTLRQSQP
ncbi:alpha-ketoglutarate-dependent dioxygenase AlkB [Bermanella sp. R86510]|uniref:alpha-ketoglutarate-dependent dioxygenase AlkB n=1 Tax=unclassified Bermanella TaxID=2627862 RepID=UPI0037CC9877